MVVAKSGVATLFRGGTVSTDIAETSGCALFLVGDAEVGTPSVRLAKPFGVVQGLLPSGSRLPQTEVARAAEGISSFEDAETIVVSVFIGPFQPGQEEAVDGDGTASVGFDKVRVDASAIALVLALTVLRRITLGLVTGAGVNARGRRELVIRISVEVTKAGVGHVIGFRDNTSSEAGDFGAGRSPVALKAQRAVVVVAHMGNVFAIFCLTVELVDGTNGPVTVLLLFTGGFVGNNFIFG